MGISLGIVGLGSFARSFVPLFKSHPLVDRIALCDREADRVARYANDPAYQDKFRAGDGYFSLDDICRADLDALVIMTQPWLHAPQAVQALEAGKHVYTAVPVITLPDSAEVLEWCERLVNTVRRTGRHYMLGETTFYRPQTMYCRRRAAENAFGRFVHAEGDYLHDVELGLREVSRLRGASRAGQEWRERSRAYQEKGVLSGPMHYPTHSVAGPVAVMNAHAVKVACVGYPVPRDDDYFSSSAFSNETALFRMSNGTTMQIREYRQVGFHGREIFRLYGTEGSFENDCWVDRKKATPVTVQEMRDPLPEEVARSFRDFFQKGEDFYGGHGGSHAYLVHEFVEAVAQERRPAVDVFQAVRYMAPGAVAHQSALRDGEWLDVPDWGDH